MLKTIINIGVNEHQNFRQRRVVQLLNIVSFAIFIFLIPLGVMNLTQGATGAGIMLFLTSFLHLLNLYWIRLGKIVISKIIICYFLTTTPFINAVFGGRIPEGQFLGLLAAILTLNMMACLIFDAREERWLLFFTIGYFITYFLVFDKVIMLFAKNPPDISFIQNNYTYYKYPALIAMVLTIVIIHVFKNIIHAYEEENEQIKAELEAQNEELATMNEHLEQRVSDRTEELKKTNERIINIGFLTSHKIRGPLASILGITQLFKDAKYMDDLKQILPKLHDRALEMDEVIGKMTDELEESNKK